MNNHQAAGEIPPPELYVGRLLLEKAFDNMQKKLLTNADYCDSIDYRNSLGGRK